MIEPALYNESNTFFVLVEIMDREIPSQDIPKYRCTLRVRHQSIIDFDNICQTKVQYFHQRRLPRGNSIPNPSTYVNGPAFI